MLGAYGYDIKGISENKPIYLDFKQIAAIMRVCSDEKQEPIKAIKPKQPAEGSTEKKIQCPFCEGENRNATIYEDKKNNEFFIYCLACGIETIDTFNSEAKALKAFSEGKTKNIAK